MANENNISRIITGVSIVILLTGCFASKQNTLIQQQSSKIPLQNTYCELKNFSAKYHSGKVYVNWLVSTNADNYYFVLEKSIDGGETFNIIHVQKGFASPTAIKEGLLYSYTDEKLVANSRIYRLRAVEPIKNGNELLLYTHSKNLFNKNIENATIVVENETAVTNK